MKPTVPYEFHSPYFKWHDRSSGRSLSERSDCYWTADQSKLPSAHILGFAWKMNACHSTTSLIHHTHELTWTTEEAFKISSSPHTTINVHCSIATAHWVHLHEHACTRCAIIVHAHGPTCQSWAQACCCCLISRRPNASPFFVAVLLSLYELSHMNLIIISIVFFNFL